MNAPIQSPGAAYAACLAALERRFGWLRHALFQKGGNVSRLRLHEQTLWHARTAAVDRFNRIGELPSPARRARAYERLTAELEARGR